MVSSSTDSLTETDASADAAAKNGTASPESAGSKDSDALFSTNADESSASSAADYQDDATSADVVESERTSDREFIDDESRKAKSDTSNTDYEDCDDGGMNVKVGVTVSSVEGDERENLLTIPLEPPL